MKRNLIDRFVNRIVRYGQWRMVIRIKKQLYVMIKKHNKSLIILKKYDREFDVNCAKINASLDIENNYGTKNAKREIEKALFARHNSFNYQYFYSARNNVLTIVYLKKMLVAQIQSAESFDDPIPTAPEKYEAVFR